MKTLDEVLKSYELSCGKKDCRQCPYDDECLDHFVCECYERMDDIMRMNIDKLIARYPDGFSAERSEHRAEGDI